MTTDTFPRKLDLGNGAQARQSEDWLTLDIASHFRPDVLGDAHRLPFADGSLRAVKAHHILEHIPRDYFVFHWEPAADVLPAGRSWDEAVQGTVRAGSRSYIEARKGLVDVMNEIWRVLEPGGQCWIEIPLFPTEEAIADPTHGSFLVSATFDYFTRCEQHSDDLGHLFTCREDHRKLYDIRPWKITQREKVNHARILVVFMTKLEEAEPEAGCEHLRTASNKTQTTRDGEEQVYCFDCKTYLVGG